MIVKTYDAVRASDRNVVTDGWESARFLLKEERMGFSFHITKLYAGGELRMHYKHHLEAVFVLSGHGTIEDLATGIVHDLAPGTLYALDAHDQHIVRPETEILAACVFNPPLTGREVHDETGAYPAEKPFVPYPLGR